MGFIFYAGSPRYVPDKDEYLDAVQSCTKTKVGVFVNETLEEILRKVTTFRLDYVQLHGDESPDFCRRLRDAGCAVIKAFSVSSEQDFGHVSAYEPFVEYFLFDTKSSERGGTGKRFDWSILEAYQGNNPFLLSGGIGAEYLEDLIAFSHPLIAGIDLNSRFELSPALKNIEKLEEFLSKFLHNLRKSAKSASSAC
jgi:phosphoribosylanthranilate isomerase